MSKSLRYVVYGLLLLNGAATFVLDAPASQEPLVELQFTSEEQTLRLLAEVAVPEGALLASAGAAAAETPVVEAPLPETPAEKVCRVWGPESDPAAFDEAVSALEADGGFPQVQSSQVAAAPDFLVFVDPAASGSPSTSIAAELKALNLESYRMNRDGNVIISVGLFRSERRARDLHARLEKVGYVVNVETLAREQTIYNLQAYVDPESPLFGTSTAECPMFAQDP